MSWRREDRLQSKEDLDSKVHQDKEKRRQPHQVCAEQESQEREAWNSNDLKEPVRTVFH